MPTPRPFTHIRGNWPVRTLKRQIATLYFEPSGLSTDKEKLAAMAQAGAESTEPKLSMAVPEVNLEAVIGVDREEEVQVDVAGLASGRAFAP